MQVLVFRYVWYALNSCENIIPEKIYYQIKCDVLNGIKKLTKYKITHEKVIKKEKQSSWLFFKPFTCLKIYIQTGHRTIRNTNTMNLGNIQRI